MNSTEYISKLKIVGVFLIYIIIQYLIEQSVSKHVYHEHNVRSRSVLFYFAPLKEHKTDVG